MYETQTYTIVTTKEEINEIIDRFYKKGGRLAEATGAETMLPYIEQRDTRIRELIDDVDYKYNEGQSMVREADALKNEVAKARREYSEVKEAHSKLVIEFNRIAQTAERHKKLLTELSKVKGFGRLVPKKLREQIKTAIL